VLRKAEGPLGESHRGVIESKQRGGRTKEEKRSVKQHGWRNTVKIRGGGGGGGGSQFTEVASFIKKGRKTGKQANRSIGHFVIGK